MGRFKELANENLIKTQVDLASASMDLLRKELEVKNFEKIKSKILEETSASSEKIEALKNEAYKILEKRLDKDKHLKKLIGRLESSKELTSVEFDDCPYQWVRFDGSDFINTDDKLEKELFEKYLLDEHCINVDWKNDCLLASVGPSLIITEEGDLYDQDSQKIVIPVDDTRDDDGEISESKRNQLIEQWMNKAGYFPSVISCDRYGNLFYVNTLKGS